MAKKSKAELKKQWQDAREDFRKWLVKHTGCDIQGGYVNGKEKDFGYPCGTCTMALLSGIGLDSEKPEYAEHDKKENRDRHNEVWRAILQIRDAKL